MFYWNKYPFVRYTFILLLGILTANELPQATLNLIPQFSIIGLLFLTYGILLLAKIFGPKIHWNRSLGIVATALLFATGFILVSFRQSQCKAHDQTQFHKYDMYTATVASGREQKQKEYKIIIEIDHIHREHHWIRSSGKVLLTIRRSVKPFLRYGDRILVFGMPLKPQVPQNPCEFHYKKYLENQQIYFVHTIEDPYFKLTGNATVNPVMAAASNTRDYCDHILRKYIHAETEYQVAAALVLGIKGNLSPEIKKAYSNTGVIHVLAVSGLHIAIIFEVLMLFFGKLKRYKYGRLLLYFGVAAVLWFFGFISGLSPSVLRAVLMFTFVLLAKLIERDSEMYNTLAASAFFLLCYNPYYAMDAGFQLSYIAVAGIVYFQPKIYNLFYLKNWFADKFWTMVSVTLAAQIATIPLIIFYFHQIPVWFLPANIVMIPGTTVLLYLGMALILFGEMSPLAYILGKGIEIILQALHCILLKIEGLPAALIEVDLGLFELFLFSFITILSFSFFSSRNIRFLQLACILTFVLSGLHTFKIYQQDHQKIFLVYTVRHKPVIGFVSGRQMTLFCDSDMSQSDINQRLKNHLIKLGIKKLEIKTPKTSKSICLAVKAVQHCKLISWEQNTILIADSGRISKNLQDFYGISVPEKLKYGIFFRRNGITKTIVNLSNEKSWDEKIIQQIKVVHLPYHNIAQQGAYVHYLQ